MSASRRVAFIITAVSDDFIDSTREWKFSALKILMNSIAETAIPSGVFPYLVIILSDRDPWLTPMRTAVLFAVQILISGISLEWILSSSSPYSFSLNSTLVKVALLST